MTTYKRDRKKVDQCIRNSGIVVVLNKKHVTNAEHMITTMKQIYEAGFIAECTFRIDEGVIREAMAELRKLRAESPKNSPFLLGVGSVINPKELESAVDMGFDMIVAPGNVMGGFGEGKEFVRLCREANVFSAPAVFTPTELQYFIERPDEFEPDAIKVFPADTHGATGIKALLAPYVRERHAGRMIMPTGGVNLETGQKYRDAISACGFFPVLGMSAPLKLVEQKNKPGDAETIQQSLSDFKKDFKTL